ncbi:hypothetical protein [Pseudomonas fluorescens]|uniref:Uncharacterized protein n=1 Tax=Pseudomonas fluorescens TaxID=294 RepID=A0A5E7N0N3_PSEFL|nr:hypothetical protein [Pseudomonas fluorescens]VVP30698.1 hypothetical protein PS880_04322 [Pseudomonas fluorescens]
MMFKQLQWSALLCSSLYWANAQAVEMTLSSNATEIPQGQIKEAIVSNLPLAVTQLGNDYQLFSIVETGDYMPGQRLYSYSVTLHRKVIESGTGKTYWVPTGGIRGHGVAQVSDTVLSNLKSDVIAGAKAGSFKLDQM